MHVCPRPHPPHLLADPLSLVMSSVRCIINFSLSSSLFLLVHTYALVLSILKCLNETIPSLTLHLCQISRVYNLYKQAYNLMIQNLHIHTDSTFSPPVILQTTHPGFSPSHFLPLSLLGLQNITQTTC